MRTLAGEGNRSIIKRQKDNECCEGKGPYYLVATSFDEAIDLAHEFQTRKNREEGMYRRPAHLTSFNLKEIKEYDILRGILPINRSLKNCLNEGRKM